MKAQFFGILLNDLTNLTPGPRIGRPSHLAVYQRLDIQIREFNVYMRGLPTPMEAPDIWEEILHWETHHSTAIEGNPLILSEVQQLLEEGGVPDSQSSGDDLEVYGYAEAAEWVYGHAAPSSSWSETEPLLTLNDVRTIHHLAMTPIREVNPQPTVDDQETPGSYRRHDIRSFPNGMTPTSWQVIPAEMATWIDQANSIRRDHPRFPAHLADLHCRFEQIHPFFDGNGRTGRLALNLILVRLGLPPAIILKRDGVKYLRALQRADRGEPGTLGGIVAQAIMGTLHRHLLPKLAAPDQLVPLEALETPDMSLNNLKVVATRGRMRALRGTDNQWRGTRSWVDEYKASRKYRAGRKK